MIILCQARYEKDVECGGGYVKVGPKMSDPMAFGDPTVHNDRGAEHGRVHWLAQRKIGGARFEPEQFYVSFIAPVVHFCRGGLEVDLSYSVIDARPGRVCALRASLREASMITTALTITRCSTM